MSGPRVAVSADGLHLAIARDHELSLYMVEPFIEIARTQLAPSATRAIAFVGRQLLVHDAAQLVVLSLQRLAATAQVKLDRATRLVAISHHYALLARDTDTLIASSTSETTTVA